MVPKFDKLLILDLDETLIHATETQLERAADLRAGKYYLYKRPHLDEFLARCFEWFSVAVWTSSSADYAEDVMSRVLGPGQCLSFLWARDRCTPRTDPETQESYWIKNLKKLKKRFPLEKIIVVDDSTEKHAQNFGNLVRVREYTGDLNDRELLLLMEYLPVLGEVPNVRTVDKRAWRVRPSEGGPRAGCLQLEPRGPIP